MEDIDILNLINNKLEKEAEKIFNELMSLYYKKEKVNKMFGELIKERLNEKYSFFYIEIERKIIKLIPFGLNICPTGEWVFITDRELNNINEKKYDDKEKKIINNFVEKVIDDITSLNYNDLFEIIENNKNKYLNNFNIFNSNYLLNIINNKLISKNIKIISIDPLKIKNED